MFISYVIYWCFDTASAISGHSQASRSLALMMLLTNACNIHILYVLLTHALSIRPQKSHCQPA